MMICKSDFEELFPHLFPAQQNPAARADVVADDTGDARPPIEPEFMVIAAQAASATIAAANRAIRGAPHSGENL